jgi:hypothetical protein
MAYSAEISRQHPTCIVFLVDQSGSMDEAMDEGVSKAQFLADVLNRTLFELIIACRKPEGVLNYFHVGALSYSGAGVASGFAGQLTGKDLCEIEAVSMAPLRVETREKRVSDGLGSVTSTHVRFPVWFDPYASGGTPMCGGLEMTAHLLEEWCQDYPDSFPPTVLHITDGEATDGAEADVERIAERLSGLHTRDGKVILMNLHVARGSGNAIRFPGTEGELPSSYARMLFRISTVMPPEFQRRAQGAGIAVQPQSRAYIYNAHFDEVIKFFQIGTLPKTAADR